MDTKTNTFGLTGNQLKIIAMVLMTIDHIGGRLLPEYRILRLIGRLAMPIFAYMIAEGCRYTKNRSRYLLTIAGFALVCQVVYLVVLNNLTQCILVTFSLSISLIYAVDYASQKKTLLSLAVLSGVFAAACYICVFLPKTLSGFSVDYGFAGVLLPVFIYMGRTREERLLLTAGGLSVLAMIFGNQQWYALLSLPLLALYNGQRGKLRMKYLFYIYYPVHLAVIQGISWLIRHWHEF